MTQILRWLITLVLAMLAGRLVSKIKLPSILGWLVVGMFFGPHAVGLMSQPVLDAMWYKTIIMWMQCAFGLMLGTELVWNRLKSYGKALIVTTLTQSLGTFSFVTLVFAVVFLSADVPVYLAFVFGGIALATAPAPALSIVNEFHAKGPVTDTLLPMAVLDDVVAIIVFFTVNSVVSSSASGGAVPLYMIPLMIFLPVLIGVAAGLPAGWLLKKAGGRMRTLVVLLAGITLTAGIGWIMNVKILSGITLNYMLMGVSFSAVFTNMVGEGRLKEITGYFYPVLAVSLLAAIVDLGAPLNYHLILGAGWYTFLYIAARGIGKYFGARFGAKVMKMPDTVQKYLGLTLLPHSGVSLVFTGIACSALAANPGLVGIVQGTVAAAAVINEVIAVIAAKKGFELAGKYSRDLSVMGNGRNTGRPCIAAALYGPGDMRGGKGHSQGIREAACERIRKAEAVGNIKIPRASLFFQLVIGFYSDFCYNGRRQLLQYEDEAEQELMEQFDELPFH